LLKLKEFEKKPSKWKLIEKLKIFANLALKAD
jgi:hypothetical protein